MRTPPYSKQYPSSATKQRPPARKKACRNCTKSKVRCDLEKPACSRCRAQGRHCEYYHSTTPPTTSSASPSNPSASKATYSGGPAAADEPLAPSTTYRGTPILFGTPQSQIDPTPPEMPIALPYSAATSSTIRSCSPSQSHLQLQSIGSSEHVKESDNFDFSALDLVPSPNAEDIRDRWLRPYILPPLGREEIPKVYNPLTLQYISRVLSTYPRCMLKHRGLPPIIHHGQIAGKVIPRALANCYALVRMWEQAVPGSEAMVVSTVEKEMERLAEEPPSPYDFERLSAFQAYLIYSIMMYFSPLGGISVINDTTMMTLMELAFRTAQKGVFCAAEISHSRPTWESWIVVSAKRRALLAMYLFSSVYNSDRLLPNFVAEEMRGVYAPGNRALWDAVERETWTKEYDRHLLVWEDGMLEISELWWSPETGSSQRRNRIERWAQTVDEFGMTVFAVCAHTHGC